MSFRLEHAAGRHAAAARDPLMAGTMPHAIFIETGLDDAGTVAAYAAELPGCATFAADADEAARRMPARVTEFTTWLRRVGEPAPAFVGDNWYEVERAAAGHGDGAAGRAAFSLDELSPSDQEFEAWMRWLELAREELASALDAADADPAQLAAVTDQDLALADQLGSETETMPDDPIDRLYAARDLLTDALAAAGPARDGVRRALRLAIADDLRLTDALRGGAR
ncbi:MAG TPA: hypothetical protein VF153_00220 [Candidatus Limnocylindria bacterium]